eukprot:1783962-Pleurochrysis_carterae.AAC.1
MFDASLVKYVSPKNKGKVLQGVNIWQLQGHEAYTKIWKKRFVVFLDTIELVKAGGTTEAVIRRAHFYA